MRRCHREGGWRGELQHSLRSIERTTTARACRFLEDMGAGPFIRAYGEWSLRKYQPSGCDGPSQRVSRSRGGSARSGHHSADGTPFDKTSPADAAVSSTLFYFVIHTKKQNGAERNRRTPVALISHCDVFTLSS